MTVLTAEQQVCAEPKPFGSCHKANPFTHLLYGLCQAPLEAKAESVDGQAVEVGASCRISRMGNCKAASR